jgi:DNA-binding transcriptional regulator/RsmH inhibitor MraZ
LPTNLMEKVDIKKNVTIIGVGNHIEIWDEEKYSKYEKDAEQKYEEASLNIANTYGKK